MAIELVRTAPLSVVILAAGKGKRMNNPEMAKVMYELDGKPMIEHVMTVAFNMQPKRTLLVLGWKKEIVIEFVAAKFPSVEFVEQREQLGTGHAVMQTQAALQDFEGDVLILSGDVPLLTEETVKALIGVHQMSGADATILTAELPDPTGYGRIIRNKDESVKKIVEQKDATKKELSIKEVNSGIYVFNKQKLFETLALITQNNAQGEYYLTGVFEHFWNKEYHVAAVKAVDPNEVLGINDTDQLENAREILTRRMGKSI
ncbi:MAG: UDP-N-acetylglucosamine pyrophosphorylase [Bacteroidetes bacterium]|nr:MAG: UDP-N-acetylglucosamine pyrophosphorylase [Bacteroidota bacterium]